MVRRAIQIRQGHLCQTVPMPETLGVMPLRDPPHGRGGRWAYRLLAHALEALDGRRADLEMVLMLQIPGETFGAKGRFVRDDVADQILFRCGEALRWPTGGGPLGQTRESEALPSPLKGPWTGGLRPVLLLDLRGTPGGLALAQGGDPLFPVEGQPIVRPLRAAWLILQGLMEGGQCPMAPCIEITPTDPGLGCNLWAGDPAEEVEDRGDALGNLRGQERWDRRHGGFLLVIDHARWDRDCVKDLECAMRHRREAVWLAL